MPGRTKPLTQAEILGYDRKLPQAAPLEPLHTSATLADLKAEQLARAQAVTVTDEQLAGWYAAQLAATEDQVTRLAEAVKQNNANAPEDPADPWWEKYWNLEARYRYAYETLALLRKRGHCLVCPNCGPGTACSVAGGPEVDWEGVSLRGLLTGEGALAWSRYCGKCQRDAGIAALGRQLLKSFREDGR